MRTPFSRLKAQVVADVLNSQHAGTGAPRANKYEDNVNLQVAKAYFCRHAHCLFFLL